MTLWSEIDSRISHSIGRRFDSSARRRVAGGCISAVYRLEGGSECFFVKLSAASAQDMLEAESTGLLELGRSGAVRVPSPVCSGAAEGSAFLVMEHIEFGKARSKSFERFGRELARLHRTTNAMYGWSRDNTIGATPQRNMPISDWGVFFREQRLVPQLELAGQRQPGASLLQKGERLASLLQPLLSDHAPMPSLLHGDLWSGNFAVGVGGEPVIFDPAVYYGDRECDIAMTELFGGFPAVFYAAYREAWPLQDGYTLRREAYNLYHILNHLNLFGDAYRARAESMIESLLAEIG